MSARARALPCTYAPHHRFTGSPDSAIKDHKSCDRRSFVAAAHPFPLRLFAPALHPRSLPSCRFCHWRPASELTQPPRRRGYVVDELPPAPLASAASPPTPDPPPLPCYTAHTTHSACTAHSMLSTGAACTQCSVPRKLSCTPHWVRY